MSLVPGTRIGAYEVVALLGAGGMGEVYRAHDRKLNRDVAIKILLAEVANDADRLARFGREALVLASLNHPNIAQLHGLEESSGVPALVMELVEGPTLADRLMRGRFALDEALAIAKQVAEALEAAHEQGVIHRDLKPANIKVRADGTVKVLDFGLAKALAPGSGIGEPRPADGSKLATVSSPALTLRGVILGTAAYMSPEQARGRVVDRRTDIWAFGCVLFEMLTGARAFKGDVPDTMVAVLSNEPDWQALPAAAASVRPLIARCLKKDPKQRLQAIGDARVQIDELTSGTPESEVSAATKPAASSGIVRLVAAAAVTAVLTALATWAVSRPQLQEHPQLTRFEIFPLASHPLVVQGADRDVAISPDGQTVVYRAGTRAELALRRLDRFDGRVLEGTANARSPFFSPDSQWIGFFDGTSLKKVAVSGGAVITICPSGIPRGASWGDDGTIVFATYVGELLRVSAGGGVPAVLTKPEVAKGENHHWFPSLLPGGRGILFTSLASPFPPGQIAALDATTGQIKTLIGDGTQAEYVETGHVVYLAAGDLHAVRFDLERLEVRSDPVVVVEGVSTSASGATNYAISKQGTLTYVPAAHAAPKRSLVWVDRKGHETPLNAPPGPYVQARLSPDGTQVALAMRDEQADIHILDIASGNLRRLTVGASIDTQPIWTNDGRIIFASRTNGPENLSIQPADGAGVPQRLTTSSDNQVPTAMTPDGTGVLGWEQSRATAADIVVFPLVRSPRGAHGTPAGPGGSSVKRLIETPSVEMSPAVSPDGRYLAFSTNASGQFEIWVRPFPNVNDGRWIVSNGGGTQPVWARNGQELFYLDLTNRLMATQVQTQGRPFIHGTPTRVLESSYAAADVTSRPYDVSRDGQRFLMIKETPTAAGEAAAPRLAVVLHWLDELKQKVPVR
jgi:eukaryotic-like serine/threonine-protein kinase